MALPALEVRHGERAVDCGVERDGDDHRATAMRRSDPAATRPGQTWWTVRPAYQPNRAGRPGRATALAATSGRCPSSRVARPHLDAPDDLPAPHRQVERRRARSPSGRAAGRGARRAAAASPRRGDREPRPYGSFASAYVLAGVDRVDDAVLRDAPREQRLQIGVALRARRAAEDRRVDRPHVRAHRRDLRPAGLVRVAGLHADHARERRRAGRSRCAACGRR